MPEVDEIVDEICDFLEDDHAPWLTAAAAQAKLNVADFLRKVARELEIRHRGAWLRQCVCSGDPPRYTYRGDSRLHCSWCDGLAE